MKVLLLFILISCLVLAIAIKIGRSLSQKMFEGNCKEWIPPDYYHKFEGCREYEGTIFEKGEEIPENKPTLLILGRFRTYDKLILIVDFLASFLTLGWIRFNEIMPVGKPLRLRLYFKNISTKKVRVEGKQVGFSVLYPGELEPSRKWAIKIPSLNTPGDSCFKESEKFFTPEVPGAHELRIHGIEGVVYAGPYGVSGRQYRIPYAGAPWRLPFHVSSNYEYRVFIIVFITLLFAAVTLLTTIIDKL